MKKSISFLLCLLMVFSLFAGILPVGLEQTASAAGGTTTEIRYQPVTNISEFTSGDNLYRNYLLVYEANNKQYALSASGMQMALGTEARTAGATTMTATTVKVAASETIGDTVYYNTAATAGRNILWGVTATGSTGEASYVRTRDESFSAAPCLYINGSGKLVLTDAADAGYFKTMRFEASGDKFVIHNGDGYIGFDGTNFCYSTAGAQFTVYKQVEAQFSSDGIVGTNLTNTAKLNSDGTYSVDMSVYTTGSKTYSDTQQIERHSRTDYVIVLDDSANMSTADCGAGYVVAGTSWAGDSASGYLYKDINGDYYQVSVTKDYSYSTYTYDYHGTGGTSIYDFDTEVTGDVWTRLTGSSKWGGIDNYFYREDNGVYYPCYYKRASSGTARFEFAGLDENGGVHNSTGKLARTNVVKIYYRTSETKYYTNYKMTYTDNNGVTHQLGSTGTNASSVMYSGELYQYKSSGVTRMEAMKTAAINFIRALSTFAQENQVETRVSIVTFDTIVNDMDDYGGYTGAFIKTGNSELPVYFQKSELSSGKLNSDNTLNLQLFHNSFFNLQNSTEQEWAVDCINQLTAGKNDDGKRSAIHYGVYMANFALQSMMQYEGRDYKSADSGDSGVVILLTGSTTKIRNTGYATNNAKTLKQSVGGEIYTVGIGTSGTYVQTQRNRTGYKNDSTTHVNVTMDQALAYISSEYPKATVEWADKTDSAGDKDGNMQSDIYLNYSNTGTRVTDMQYCYMTSGGSIDLSFIFERILKERVDISFSSQQSSTMGVELNAASTIENTFNLDKFDTSSAVVTLTFEKGYSSDGKSFEFRGEILSEAQFEAATGQNVSGTVQNGKLVVTGYDYSKNYVSKSTNGYKMHVNVSNIKLKDGTYGGMELCDSSTCAIYDKGSEVNKFKAFPTFYVPKEDYAVDFGLNLNVASGQTATGVIANTQSASAGTALGTSTNLANLGTLSTNGFKLAKNSSTAGHGYVLTQTDGKYQWNLVNLAPASNVLFEEDVFTQSGTSTYQAWSRGSGNTATQSNDTTSCYGYDAAYNEANCDSNGSAYSVSVSDTDKNTKNSQTLSTSFYGKGFDLISSCGTNTGVLSITVFKDGVFTKAYVVDTFFNDSSVGSLLKQVPVVHYSGDYGNYTVNVKAIYMDSGAVKAAAQTAAAEEVANNNLMAAAPVTTAAAPETENVDAEEVFGSEAAAVEAGVEQIIEDQGLNPDTTEVVYLDEDSVLNGGEGTEDVKQPVLKKLFSSSKSSGITCYVDGIRIYKPLNNDDSKYSESEQGMKYYNIVDNLREGNLALDGTVGALYVEGNSAKGIESFAATNYERNKDNGGPEGEIYLGKDQGIAIQLSSSAKVQISARAVKGSAKLSINGVEQTITSGTEMYYSGSSNDSGVLTISNTGGAGSLLAIAYLKTDASIGALSAPRFAMAKMLFATAPTTYVEESYPVEDDSAPVEEVYSEEQDNSEEYDFVYDNCVSSTGSTSSTVVQTVQKAATTVTTAVKSFFGKLFGRK